GSWAQMGRNSNHSGYNPTIPSTCSDVRWNVETDGPLTTPTIVNDRVYLDVPSNVRTRRWNRRVVSTVI
ncbi:MAG: hypothetical protein WBV42_17975, partial [Haladaptatus sp.]